MAARPIEPLPSSEVTPSILMVAVDEIEVGQRLRAVDPVFAEAIGRSMASDGQATPIVVCRLPGQSNWTLVAGAHRVAGAKLRGISHLRAEVIGAREDERAQREVSENLWRRGLDPIERAAFIAKQVELIKIRKGIDPAKDGRAASANARWGKRRSGELREEAQMQMSCLTDAYGWSDEVAEALGVSVSTVQRGIALYSRLAPSLVARLRSVGHPALSNGNELHRLTRLHDRLQSEVVQLLVDGGARSVSEALATLNQRPKADPATKRLSTFIGTFQRMGLAEKKGALAQLAALLPAGLAIADETSANAPDISRIVSALEVSFGVIASLCIGEGVDDDQLEAARRAGQNALFESRGCKVDGDDA